MESTDKLGLLSNPDFEKIINFDSEPIMFSNRIHHLNRWNIKSERSLVLTDKFIYEFQKKTLNKKIPISDCSHIIKNLTNLREVLLLFEFQNDLRFLLDEREEFLNLLKLRFACVRPDITLRVYGVAGSNLREYLTNKKKRNKVDNLPREDFRHKTEEI